MFSYFFLHITKETKLHLLRLFSYNFREANLPENPKVTNKMIIGT